ncbi:MAG: hypothetical protein AAFW98_03155, partial [Pseudomonadota bacterium]
DDSVLVRWRASYGEDFGDALSPEAQSAFTEAMYYAPVNAKAAVSDETKARTAMDSLDKMLPIDWGWVATIRDEWNQKWRRQIISAN